MNQAKPALLRLKIAVFFIFFLSLETRGNELLLSVNAWNTRILADQKNSTMTCSEGTLTDNVKNTNQFTFYRNGLIGTECGKTFATDIRLRDEFKDQYPGMFIVSHGPVNNRIEENSWFDWFKSVSYLKPMVRVCAALPYAFNYEEEAKLMIQSLQFLDDCNNPVKCIQTICYGFQGIICGIHALISTDSNAQKIRTDLKITAEQAEKIVQNVHLLIAQAPMMRASDTVNCVIKQGIPNIIIGTQIGLIALIIILQRYQILDDAFIYNSVWCIFAMNRLNIPFCIEHIRSLLTPFAMRFVVPLLSPAIANYQGDITVLLQRLQQEAFKNKFPKFTLLVTHQTCDEFVGPLSAVDQALLTNVFSKTILVPSSEKDHLHESDEQKSVEHFIRSKKGMAFDSNLTALGEIWCAKNGVTNVYQETFS
jgi:hypothetical protein